MFRMNSRRSSVAAIAVFGLIAASCSSTTSSAPTGAELVHKASIAAATAGSVNYTLKATATPTKTNPSPAIESLVAAVSAPTSTQSLRFSDNTNNLDVSLINGTIYVRGDNVTLNRAFGFPVAASSKYAGTWISIPPSDPTFAQIAGTLTLDSQTTPFFPVGQHVIIGKTRTLKGRRVIPLTGPSPANSSIKSGTLRLYIDEKTHLPVAAGLIDVLTNGAKGTEVVDFISWGRPVNAVAPSGAVPISTAIKG